MRTKLIGLLSAIMMLASGAAHADRLVVVELFTSQGCSSCPPADALLGELAERRDVLPLALHVDYWDYIGWKDEFASPEHTERQRNYARAAGARSIFTPQMIVGGKDHVIGYKPMKLAMLIDEHGEMSEPARISASLNGSKIEVRIDAKGRVPAASRVLLVAYRENETVSIRRGENAGRTLTYHNIVEQISEIGTWNGQGPYRVNVSADGASNYAVLVQSANSGPILGAAKVR